MINSLGRENRFIITRLGQISMHLTIILTFALTFFLAAAYGFSRKDG